MSKGSAFEREVCKLLSLWWAGDDNNDSVFWRTSNSGGRATTRSKGGKRTNHQYGDLCATDPVGQPFCDLFTVEVKRGYSCCSLMDLLDKRPGAAEQIWEKWLKKVIKDAELARTPYWLLITRRDRRQTMVVTPLDYQGGILWELKTTRFWWGKKELVCLPLRDWMEMVSPEWVREAAYGGRWGRPSPTC